MYETDIDKQRIAEKSKLKYKLAKVSRICNEKNIEKFCDTRKKILFYANMYPNKYKYIDHVNESF